MHRFRKWSDPKRSTFSESVRSSAASSRTSTHPSEPLPALPPVGDFRTSLILPDLSRRFTLLRASSGDSISLGDLKTRLVEQRARGAENHLSEEEMDTFLQTLGRLRSKPSASSTSGDSIDSLARESLPSTETTPSSVTPSPRSTKRYSNNMFGSGKFKDHTYLRSVARERTGGRGSAGRRGANSSSPTISGRSYLASDTIPEDSSQTDIETSAHDSDTTPLVSGVESSELEQGVRKTFQPGHIRRASLALEEVIREIEEESGGDGDGDGDGGDDKILIPRSPAPERVSSLKRRSVDKSRPVPSSEPTVYETGTAVSSDPPMQVDAAEFRSSPSPYPRAETSPIPRLPGYIPGMPRPMTPRETTFDPDDELFPSSSSTPRATSPRIPGTDRATSPSSILRRDSTSVRHSHRTSSPLQTNPSAPITSLLTGVNGRFSPDRSQTPDGPSVEFGSPHDSSLLGRRRPVSPYSQGTYQSMSMSSRPSTPSTVTWKAPTSPGSGNAGGHSRSGSAVGFSEIDFAMAGLPSQVRNGFDRPSMHTRDDSNASLNDLHDIALLNRSGSQLGSRSLRSPPLPDSPVLESAAQSNGALTLTKRGQHSLLGNDNGSTPLGSAALRSSTPTQYPPRSTASPALSEHDLGRSSQRGSRQATASPFTLNQSQPLVLSPLANSSRSSLESAGSSYHTWEADKQDRMLPLVASLESQPPAWHDLSYPTNELGPAADKDVEEIVQQYAGLNKGDFVAIQERLVFAARLKAKAPEPRERRISLRKRRPSQSAADTIQQGSSLRPTSQDNALKANALLDSVVNSIQAPRTKISGTPIELRMNTDVVASSTTEPEPSSATRRQNALARALFGSSDSEQSLTSLSPPPTDEPTNNSVVLPVERPPLIEPAASSHSLRETLSPSSRSLNADILTSSSSATEPADKQRELVKEIRRRTNAAMADLNRTSSNAKANDPSQRRRIEPSQISGPKLVSASTSVDTIPVRSPSAASGQLSPAQNQPLNSSKLGTRFKKFRGSLRAKPTLAGSDGFPQHSVDSASADGGDRSLAGTPDRSPPFSAKEPARPKVAIVTPPASAAAAGPGLKGLVSRFLKPRSDTPEIERRKQVASSSSSLATPSYFSQQQLERHPETHQTVRSAPADNKSFRPHTPVSPESVSSPVNPSVPSSVPEAAAARAVDETALKQFIDAANNLGLDQAALTEFLARSPSVGSRLTSQGAKHMSTPSDRFVQVQSKSGTPLNEPTPPLAVGSSPRRDFGQSPQRPSGEDITKAPIRRPLARNVAASDATNSTVVRRTLIFPSEAKQSTLDPGTGLRKSSSTRRRRSTSAVSMLSNRSLHDRVPTPPPPKSAASRRFSTEQSPPMPHIPNSLLAQTEAINAPQPTSAIPLEKSNSAYDSLYEMYTGDGKPAISVTADAQQPEISGPNPSALHNLEPGTAVEVLEMANGETIWSIVNGLRDEDEESYYGSRASFVSEYSVRDEGVQLFFKEHGRSGSKDSQSSFLPRKKATPAQKRPDTKVFFSSSAQIGRLIDNLSHGAEAGSFNIMPTAHNGTPSHPDPAHWTVEERLEHLLSSLGTS